MSIDPAPDVGARLRIVAGALLFSTGGLAIKLCSLTPWQVACFRSGIAALTLALLVPRARRGWTWRTGLVAVPYAATLILFTLANRATTAANAIFLQDTALLWVVVLAPWLLAERPARGDLVYVGATFGGLLLILAGSATPGESAPDPVHGDALATLAGFAWGLTLLGMRWLARIEPDGVGTASLAAALAGNMLAALFAASAALPVESAGVADWLLVAWLGLFQVALVYVLITPAMVRLPALEVSLLLLLEPVVAPLWVWLVLGEGVAPLALAGGALILGSTAVRALLNARSLA